MTQEKNISKSPSGRVKRTPLGPRNKLTVVGKDPNYEYRIVNDKGDRIGQFQEAGWELVEASAVKVGDRRVDVASAEGSKAQISVGEGQKAFVMRIKKEWYQDDQEAKQREVDYTEQSMYQEARDGKYGEFKTRSSLSRENKDD